PQAPLRPRTIRPAAGPRSSHLGRARLGARGRHGGQGRVEREDLPLSGLRPRDPSADRAPRGDPGGCSGGAPPLAPGVLAAGASPHPAVTRISLRVGPAPPATDRRSSPRPAPNATADAPASAAR